MYFVEDNASDTIENSVSIRSHCPVFIFQSRIVNCFCLLSLTLPGVLELHLQARCMKVFCLGSYCSLLWDQKSVFLKAGKGMRRGWCWESLVPSVCYSELISRAA